MKYANTQTRYNNNALLSDQLIYELCAIVDLSLGVVIITPGAIDRPIGCHLRLFFMTDRLSGTTMRFNRIRVVIYGNRKVKIIFFLFKQSTDSDKNNG